MFRGLFGRGPKRASKVEEQKLIMMAKKIKAEPEMVIPTCESSCFLCPFKKEKKYVNKLKGVRDDRNKLESYSKRGPDLTKAVAAAMILAHDGKAKVLANAKTPQGNISYAKRGNAGAKYLVGVQHFDDPYLRLMAYHDHAKKGYHIYSWEDRLVCTAKEDKPPKEYVKSMISSSPYRFRADGKVYSCPHDLDDRTHLSLTWRSPGLLFKVCGRCARDDTNLFIHFGSGIASRENSDLFTVGGRYVMECASDCDNCLMDSSMSSLKSSTREEYLEGSISDQSFVEKVARENRAVLSRKGTVYAVGERCYGKDGEEFLASLRYEDWEEDILRKVMEFTGPVMLEHGTVNELLEKVWDEKAKEVLGVMLDDSEVVEELVSDSSEIPREVVRKARKLKTEMDEISSLPSFREIPHRARFAHDMVIAYKTQGTEGALNFIKEQDPRDTRMKAIAYGFLYAVGRAQANRWKYDDTEVETGEFLSEYFLRLFENSGEEYARTLQELLKMSGSTETIVLKDGTRLR